MVKWIWTFLVRLKIIDGFDWMVLLSHIWVMLFFKTINAHIARVIGKYPSKKK